MAKPNEENRHLDSDGKDEARKNAATSGNREESMNESNSDKFGKQSSSKSGTTPLGGETVTSNDKPGPGGVEGTGGTT